MDYIYRIMKVVALLIFFLINPVFTMGQASLDSLYKQKPISKKKKVKVPLKYNGVVLAWVKWEFGDSIDTYYRFLDKKLKIKQGVSKRFYKNGVIFSEVNYYNDKKVGREVKYDLNGLVYALLDYNDGQLFNANFISSDEQVLPNGGFKNGKGILFIYNSQRVLIEKKVFK